MWPQTYLNSYSDSIVTVIKAFFMVYWYQQSIKSPNSNIKALYWRRCKTESRFYLVPMFFFKVISHLQKLWAKFHGILLVYLSYTVLAHTQTLCGHQIFSNCKLVQQHTSFNFYYFYLYLFSQKRMMSCNVTLGKLIPFFFLLGKYEPRSAGNRVLNHKN